MRSLQSPEARRFRFLSRIALLAAVLVAAQVVWLLATGSLACLNEGCRVVEGQTRVPTLVFNLIGLGWFLAASLALGHAGARHPRGVEFARLLLLGGIAAEGVFVGYQAFAAQAWCAWCLTVLGFVVLLNLLAGGRHFLHAASAFVAVLAAFSMLRFGLPARPPVPGARGLDAGTYGVRRCSEPQKTLYLVFSSSCPHCKEVLLALENCNSCDFHFNPVDSIGSLGLEKVERAKTYDPAVNRSLLALLGIDSVPVLLDPTEAGVTVIRGEKRILDYIRTQCFLPEPGIDPRRVFGGDPFAPGGEDEEGCKVVEEDCPPEEQPPPGTPSPF